MARRTRGRVGLGFAACIFAQTGWAQGQTPDAGSVLRGADPSQRLELPRNATHAQRENLAEPASDAARVRISSVRVVGSTQYKDAEWQALLSDVLNRDLSYTELRRAADRITRRYRADGRFARAYLPEQTLTDGVLTIAVIEAKLGKVRIEAPAEGTHVSEGLIRNVLTAGQEGRDSVALDELERAAMLLEETPGIRASVVLAPGANAGETDILARIDNSRRFGATLMADNSGL